MIDYDSILAFDAPSPFSLILDQSLLKTWHFDVSRLSLGHQDETLSRDIEVHRGSAAIVALTKDLQIALVRQFRIPLGRWTLEIPTGGLELDEDAKGAALRELQEETGLIASELTQLTRFANSPGHSTQWTTIFLAENCVQGISAPCGAEEQSATVHIVPIKDALTMVQDGLIVDAKTIIGILAAEKLTRK